jgi:hypothetical protein
VPTTRPSPLLLGMLVAMLLRVDEYTSHAHHTVAG